MTVLLDVLGKQAKTAAGTLATAGTDQKNQALLKIAEELMLHTADILDANLKDINHGTQIGLAKNLIDRLTLDRKRIAAMAEGVRQIAALPDPIGQVDKGFVRPNGLKIEVVRVPMGVIGVIYEARPNVTVDAAALCLKTGNAVILRGGSDASASSICLTQIMQQAIESVGLDKHCIQYVEDPSRETASAMMRLSYLDVLIPRGGAGLIRTVKENSTVPVIETGVGNCHVYVDKAADTDKALAILLNAKTQRTSVCNAAESLLVHRAVADTFLPKAADLLISAGVELFACKDSLAILGRYKASPATEEDFAKEYLSLKMSIKVVDSVEEAVAHINKYGTHHSDAIVTEDYTASETFLAGVDSAAVYVNASTRFTDGFEFGFGGEIGISTQKLHARGPMGPDALTTVKYCIRGNGQTRP